MCARTFLTVATLVLLLPLGAGTASFAGEKTDPQPQWRDPFRYGSNAAAKSTRQHSTRDALLKTDTPEQGLSGIFVSNGAYQALYNGQLVNPGDRVGGLLFREITLYAVVVEDRTGRRRIELFHEQ